jgi:hypothetical protein
LSNAVLIGFMNGLKDEEKEGNSGNAEDIVKTMKKQ